ncbi:MAG: hypothetical protein ACI93T_003520, partial [Porticoccaceae bacterium]
SRVAGTDEAKPSILTLFSGREIRQTFNAKTQPLRQISDNSEPLP